MNAPLVCFPLRIEWEVANGLTATPVPAYPPPLTDSDTVLSIDAPRPVTDLEMYAMQHGWTVRLTYSEGWEPHATHGRPGDKPKIKWAVRMRRGSQRAVAVRTEDKWSSFWTWSTSQFFRRHTLLDTFKGAIR